MSDETYLLDTSAVLTLLEDEEGADRVQELLESARVLLPFPVLLEVYCASLRERSEEVADQRYGLIKQVPVESTSGK